MRTLVWVVFFFLIEIIFPFFSFGKGERGGWIALESPIKSNPRGNFFSDLVR